MSSVLHEEIAGVKSLSAIECVCVCVLYVCVAHVLL